MSFLNASWGDVSVHPHLLNTYCTLTVWRGSPVLGTVESWWKKLQAFLGIQNFLPPCVCMSVHVISCIRFSVTPPVRWATLCSPPGTSVYRVIQARILEWVAISFSRDLPASGIKPMSPALAGGFFTTSTTWDNGHRWCQCQLGPLSNSRSRLGASQVA